MFLAVPRGQPQRISAAKRRVLPVPCQPEDCFAAGKPAKLPASTTSLTETCNLPPHRPLASRGHRRLPFQQRRLSHRRQNLRHPRTRTSRLRSPPAHPRSTSRHGPGRPRNLLASTRRLGRKRRHPRHPRKSSRRHSRSCPPCSLEPQSPEAPPPVARRRECPVPVTTTTPYSSWAFRLKWHRHSCLCAVLEASHLPIPASNKPTN